MAKPKEFYSTVPDMPGKMTKKKKRPRFMAVVDAANCTGCEACVPFCPVDCIELVPDGTYSDIIIQPVQIREHECIGCKICERVCRDVTWDAIEMLPIDEFEASFGMTITDQMYPGEVAAPAALA